MAVGAYGWVTYLFSLFWVVPFLGSSFSFSSCFAFLLCLSISSVDVACLWVCNASLGGDVVNPEWCIPEQVVSIEGWEMWWWCGSDVVEVEVGYWVCGVMQLPKWMLFTQQVGDATTWYANNAKFNKLLIYIGVMYFSFGCLITGHYSQIWFKQG